MTGILQDLPDNKLNQRQGDTMNSSLVTLPFKPPPSKRASMVQDGHDSSKRQSIIIVEDYIPSEHPGELRSRISITDFKKQLNQKRVGHPMRYRPRIKDSLVPFNHSKVPTSSLLDSYTVGDEIDTSLDCIVESLGHEDQDGSAVGPITTTTRCVVCNRILYDLIPCESDTMNECVCSHCIEPYNRMIETINKYDYSTTNETNTKPEFSNRLKQTLRDILKS